MSDKIVQLNEQVIKTELNEPLIAPVSAPGAKFDRQVSTDRAGLQTEHGA